MTLTPNPQAQIHRMVLSLEAGRVKRYHAAPTVESQTDGQHMWGVSLIVLYLCYPDLPSVQLLAECTMHDVAEVVNGDPPYDVKCNNPEVKVLFDQLDEKARVHRLLLPPIDLTPADKALLKIADTLEGFIWCHKTERGDLIRNRWRESFRRAMSKFAPVISNAQYKAATELFTYFNLDKHENV